MQCTFKRDKSILWRDIFRISCRDSERAQYITMGLSAVDIIVITKEYISRTRCRNGLLENMQAAIQ